MTGTKKKSNFGKNGIVPPEGSDCTKSRHCFSWSSLVWLKAVTVPKADIVSRGHLWFDWRQWLYQEQTLFLVVILGLIEGSDCTKSRHCFSWSSLIWLKAVTVPRADIVSRGHLGFDWRQRLYQEQTLFLVVIFGLIEGSDSTKSRHCFSWSSLVWLKAVTVPRADIVSRGHLWFDWRQWLYQEQTLFLVVIFDLIEGSDCTKSRHCFSWSSLIWLKAATVPRADIVSRGHLWFIEGSDCTKSRHCFSWSSWVWLKAVTVRADILSCDYPHPSPIVSHSFLTTILYACQTPDTSIND